MKKCKELQQYSHNGVCVCSLESRPTLCDLWTVALQAPLPMGFSRQECWSGLLCPPPGDFPEPEIERISPVSLALQADSLLTEPAGKPTFVCILRLLSIHVHFQPLSTKGNLLCHSNLGRHEHTLNCDNSFLNAIFQ